MTETKTESACGASLSDVGLDAEEGKLMEQYRIDVLDEKSSLDEKLMNLGNFCNTPIFAGIDPAEASRLNRQYLIMELYSQVLAERIEAFGT